MESTISVIIAIIMIVSVVANLGLLISKKLGKSKWENIFKIVSEGIDTAKQFIPADKKVDINGKLYFPHTANIMLNAEDNGVDKDIAKLLDKHGLNKKKEE
jgi:hypothetical protein